MGSPAVAPWRALLAVLLLSRRACCDDKRRELALLEKATRSGIVPDLIEALPKAMLKASFEAGRIQMGNAFTPKQASSEPMSVEFPRTAGYKYAIAMLDPDAPSYREPKFRPTLHWLVVNVDAGDVAAPVDLKTGTLLYKYRGPKPPLGSGQHRYVLLAYRQQRDVPASAAIAFEKRKNFNMGKFANDEGLGKPVAINYFISEDCHVDGVTPFVVWVMVVLVALTGVVGRFAMVSP